jgi:HSP20 family molecular chaperone IbpA
MKGTRGFGPVDLGTIFDEIFEAARDFQNEFRKNFNDQSRGHSHGESPWCFDENTDYYPNYSYPPMNIYMTGDRSLIFEFALAGFEENDISLSFQGDYMVFQAAMSRAGTADGQNGEASVPDESIRYFKRRLKMKDIEKQKYFVPMDKYAQDKVKAVFRNGILKVTVPPREELEQNGGIKIEIIT